MEKWGNQQANGGSAEVYARMQGQVNKMDNNERKPSHTNAETNATVLPPRPHSVIAKAAARTGIESSLNGEQKVNTFAAETARRLRP